MAVLASCLLGACLLQACGHPDASVRDFTQVSQRPAKALELGNTLEAAKLACTEETKTKGIATITAIFSRLRKGSADEDFIACMKERGFEATQ